MTLTPEQAAELERIADLVRQASTALDALALSVPRDGTRWRVKAEAANLSGVEDECRRLASARQEGAG